MGRRSRNKKLSRGESVIMIIAALLALIPAAAVTCAIKYGSDLPEKDIPLKEIETLSYLDKIEPISSDDYLIPVEEPEDETSAENTDTDGSDSSTGSDESIISSETVAPKVYDSDYAAGIFASIQQTNSDFKSTVLGATADGGNGYLDRIIFVGDSTTYGLKRYGMLSAGYKTKQVWTPASGTLALPYASIGTIVYPDDGSEITIAQAAARKQPDIMVITLGVNGVSFMNSEKIKSAYSLLLDDIIAVSPNTKIILQSIFPVAAHYEKIRSINNEKITAANHCIAELAKEYGIGYLNTIEYLIGDDGFLPVGYQNGDGLHLNEKGYSLELEYIRTHMISDSSSAQENAVPQAPADEYTETESVTPDETLVTETEAETAVAEVPETSEIIDTDSDLTGAEEIPAETEENFIIDDADDYTETEEDTENTEVEESEDISDEEIDFVLE